MKIIDVVLFTGSDAITIVMKLSFKAGQIKSIFRTPIYKILYVILSFILSSKNVIKFSLKLYKI